MMALSTTRILQLLDEKPGRYIHHDMGRYRMKEPNGDDVRLTRGGRKYPAEPTAEQMDDLMDAKWLVRDGLKYLLS
jgi:hypothetical protein